MCFPVRTWGQWTKGKSCDNFTPTGSWLVIGEEIEHVSNLPLQLRVNQQFMQNLIKVL